MIEVRKLTSEEQEKRANMKYVMNINDNVRYFTEVALRELRNKINDVLE